jgi:hypothetical protein
LVVWTSHEHRAPIEGNYLQFATKNVFTFPRAIITLVTNLFVPGAHLSLAEKTNARRGWGTRTHSLNNEKIHAAEVIALPQFFVSRA